MIFVASASRLVENGDKDLYHEIHRRVIVVMQDDPVLFRFPDLLVASDIAFRQHILCMRHESPLLRCGTLFRSAEENFFLIYAMARDVSMRSEKAIFALTNMP